MKSLELYINEAYTESIFDLIDRGAVKVEDNTQAFQFANQAMFLKWWKAFNDKFGHPQSAPEYMPGGSVVVFSKGSGKSALVLSKMETIKFLSQNKNVEVVQPRNKS